jgi:hypothetical protein
LDKEVSQTFLFVIKVLRGYFVGLKGSAL